MNSKIKLIHRELGNKFNRVIKLSRAYDSSILIRNRFAEEYKVVIDKAMVNMCTDLIINFREINKLYEEVIDTKECLSSELKHKKEFEDFLEKNPHLKGGNNFQIENGEYASSWMRSTYESLENLFEQISKQKEIIDYTIKSRILHMAEMEGLNDEVKRWEKMFNETK